MNPNGAGSLVAVLLSETASNWELELDQKCLQVGGLSSAIQAAAFVNKLPAIGSPASPESDSVASGNT